MGTEDGEKISERGPKGEDVKGDMLHLLEGDERVMGSGEEPISISICGE